MIDSVQPKLKIDKRLEKPAWVIGDWVATLSVGLIAGIIIAMMLFWLMNLGV